MPPPPTGQPQTVGAGLGGRAAAAAAAGPPAQQPSARLQEPLRSPTTAPAASTGAQRASKGGGDADAFAEAAAEAPAPLASGPTMREPLSASLDMAGTVVILTGGTSGIGLEAAKTLCAKNAHVLILGDNMDSGRKALRLVQEAVPKARVDLFECDLASLRSVRTFAAAFRQTGMPLPVLALNAGSFLPRYSKTEDGFEYSMATSFLGHFYLAHLLLPDLQAAVPSRIVWQASAFEQLGIVPWGDIGGEFARDSDLWQYSNAKLCSIMAVREMARRLKGTGVNVFACHPGLVNTPLYDKTSPSKPGSWLFSAGARLFGQSAKRGAYSLVYASGATELDGKGGAYFGPPYLGPLSAPFFNTSRLTPLNPRAHNAESCRELYEETVRLLESKIGAPLPNKIPGAYREHPWQEVSAGRDRAHPVDSTLDPSQPPYRAHEAVAHLKQAVRGATGGSSRPGKGGSGGSGVGAGEAGAAAGKRAGGRRVSAA